VIPAEAKSQQEGGNANIVATMSDRSAIIPDVKGMSELGYAVSMDNMKGLMLPAKTPDGIAKFHETLFDQVMKGKRVVELAEKMNIELGYMDGPTFMKAMLATSKQVMELRKK
jgi:tripartite-type tricarboxylate transporter receptor subunit TctC